MRTVAKSSGVAVASLDSIERAPRPPASASTPDLRAGPDVNCEFCEIRHLALCAGLEDHEIGDLEAIVVHVTLGPGRTLFCEGDTDNYVFNVTSGAIRLYKLLSDGRRQITGFMLPGDYLGLATGKGYAYSAEAITETRLCRFPADDLAELLIKYPKLERRLLGMTRDELATAQDQMLLLGRKTPVEKLASFLLDLSGRAVRLGHPDDEVRLPMSRGDVADYLGLTVETVSRTLSRIKGERIIHMPESNLIRFRDRERLEDLAVGL